MTELQADKVGVQEGVRHLRGSVVSIASKEEIAETEKANAIKEEDEEVVDKGRKGPREKDGSAVENITTSSEPEKATGETMAGKRGKQLSVKEATASSEAGKVVGRGQKTQEEEPKPEEAGVSVGD